MKLHLQNRYLELKSPVVMGVLNVTPDSFSDGGHFHHLDDALKHAGQMIKDGAAIIDVGGESSRPGARAVDSDEEIDRILPVIEKIKEEFQVIVSVDTYKDRVAKTAVTEAGADMVNDISGLQFSDNMAETVAKLDVPVVLMHIKGTPENMQTHPYYQELIPELKHYFYTRIDYALTSGIKKEKIIIDPGLGFGKRVEDNIEIIRKLGEFKEFELPIMIGLSRKSFLGAITGEPLPLEREAETLCANMVAILNGASIIRVHHVKNTVKAIKVLTRLADRNLL